MHFTAYLLPLVTFASFALAGPVDNTVTSVEVVQGAHFPVNEAVSESRLEPTPVDSGWSVSPFESTGTTEVSPRARHNPLEERSSVAIFVYTGTACNGNFYAYDLGASALNTCYKVHAFNSVRISSSGGLNYAVLVGKAGCSGLVQLSYVSTCYHVTPTLSTFFKTH